MHIRRSQFPGRFRTRLREAARGLAIACIAVQYYLSIFRQRIELTPLPFALSPGFALAAAWAALATQVLRAAGAIRPLCCDRKMGRPRSVASREIAVDFRAIGGSSRG